MVPAIFKPVIKPSSPWLSPVGNAALRGGLKDMVNHYSDSRGNLFTPKGHPSIKRTPFTYVSFEQAS